MAPATHFLRFRIVFLSLAGAGLLGLRNLSGAQPDFGSAPRSPSSVAHLPRGPLTQSATGGFVVDVSSREAVRNFFNAVYPTSDDVAMASSADVAGCIAGTNGTAFREAVLRRINWFRAMAGVPAAVTFDAGFNAKDQRAALMMSANTNVSHSPPADWRCFTPDGAEAAAQSNLALGVSGAEAITFYVWDFGGANAEVGHRRWLLYPQTQVMGTGDVPAQNDRQAANANWVQDGHFFDPRPPTRAPFVAWPPEGFVPRQVVFPRWSFSYPNAGFSGATVTMSSNGVPVPVVVATPIGGMAENTLVWVPLGLDPVPAATQFPFGGTDTVYSVTISNIVGMPETSYTYMVTVFDPAVPGPDHQPVSVSGPIQPYVNTSNVYTCTVVTNADSYEWRAAPRVATPFFDGAENGLGNFIANTSAGYAVITNKPSPPTGSFLFHLAQPEPAAEQSLALDRFWLVTATTQLRFRSRLARATTSQVARVQVSLDDGLGWEDLYRQTGTGESGEGNFTLRTLSLSNHAGRSVRLRFNYHREGFGSYEPGTDKDTGWFLDDIAVTNVQQLASATTTPTPAPSFAFAPVQSGPHALLARPLLFGGFPIAWGPALEVDVTQNAPPVIVLSQPLISDGQVQLDFAVQSGAATSFQLLEADTPASRWSTNASATLTINIPGSSYYFRTAISGVAKYYRVQTP